MIFGIVIIAVGVVIMAVFGAIGNYYIQKSRTESSFKTSNKIIESQESLSDKIIDNNDNNNKEIIQNIGDKLNESRPILDNLDFEAQSRKFFQENGNNFKGFDSIFKFGYYGIHQQDNSQKPFKKSFGAIETNEFIDFSNIYVDDKYEHGFNSKIVLEISSQTISGYKRKSFHETAGVFFHENFTRKLQVMMTTNYGSPKYQLYTVIITLTDSLPFNFVVGPIDIQDLRKMEVYHNDKIFDFEKKYQNQQIKIDKSNKP